MPLDSSLPTTSSQAANVSAAMATDVKLSVFPNKFCTEAPALKMGSLAALAKMIRETPPAAKEALPFIKLARFNGERNPKPAPGTKLPSYRYDAGVVEIYGVEGDYDGGKVTMAEAARMLNSAGIEALLYSSPSSTPLAPRWRVLAPTAVPHAPARRRDLLARLNGALGGILAGESFTLSQGYYFGPTPGCTVETIVTKGQRVDTLERLDGGRVYQNGKSSPDPERPAVAAPDGLVESDDAPELLAELRWQIEHHAELKGIGETPTGKRAFDLACWLGKLRVGNTIISAEAMHKLLAEEYREVTVETIGNALAVIGSGRGSIDPVAHRPGEYDPAARFGAEPKVIPGTLRRIALPPSLSMARVKATLEKHCGPGKPGLPPGLTEADLERERPTITFDEMIKELNKKEDITIVPIAKSGRRLILVKGSDVKATPITWLWKNYLAAGKLHLIAGRKGDAKSTITVDLAARLSNGTPWPDGSPSAPGDTLIFSSEDDFEDTILPRFMAAGGNRDRFINIGGSVGADGDGRQMFDPSRDIPLLEDAISQVPDCRLLILDPFALVIRAEQGNNAGNRRDMHPVVDFAARRGIAILGITHFNKESEKKDVIDRYNGSLAQAAQARVLLGTAADPEGNARRMVRVASNISSAGGSTGIEYTVETAWVKDDGKDIATSRICWGAQLHGAPAALLAAVAEKSAQLNAIDFLRQQITESGGSIAVNDLKRAAAANQVAWRTVERARARGKATGEIISYQDGTKWRVAFRENIPASVADGGYMSN